jgi:RNA polymerase sigma factor (sigma-70 family)
MAPPTVNPDPLPSRFPATTRWSLVLRARGHSPEARAALSELCAAYYEPVFRSLRSQGLDEDSARELSQEFFAHILQGGYLDGADPNRGRFRSYLLGALRHFLSDLRAKAHRLKRGAGIPTEPLGDSNEPSVEPASAQFDRDWATTLMARAIGTLADEYRRAGRCAWFEELKPWLAGSEPPGRQAAVAAQLGLSEGALKVAIHRLRKRFREVVLDEIRQTLPDTDAPEDELRYLIELLSQP